MPTKEKNVLLYIYTLRSKSGTLYVNGARCYFQLESKYIFIFWWIVHKVTTKNKFINKLRVIISIVMTLLLPNTN